MLMNYLKIAYRLLARRRLSSFINVAGLSLSVVCFIFALTWCQGELNYDRCWEGADRIYRVWTRMKGGDGAIDWALSSPRLSGALMEFPEVQGAVRVLGSSDIRVVTRIGEKSFSEEGFFFSDASFFEVFGVPLLRGDARSALGAPFTCVVSEEIAGKYSGSGDALGKTLTVEWYGGIHDFQISGVMPDIPHRAHMHPRFLASLSSLGPNEVSSIWQTCEVCTYVRLRPGASQEAFDAKLPPLIERAMGPKWKDYGALYSQPVTDIHLDSPLRADIEPPGSFLSVLALGTSGILVLLLAVVNFISLSTAGANDRARALAVRTIFGATRGNLTAQFIVEHGLLVAFAVALGIVLTLILQSDFRGLLAGPMDLSVGNLASLLALGAAIALLAAVYPALILSRLPVLPILRGTFAARGGRNRLRNAFVTLQFTIATALLACTLVISRQLDFALKTDLGFKTERTLIVHLREPELKAKRVLLENEFRQLKGVEAVSASLVPPTNFDGTNSVSYQATNLTVRNLPVDDDFIEAMGLTLVSGRNFKRGSTTDSTEALVVNESAARSLAALGILDKPLSITLDAGTRKGMHVIGIVKDFHMRPLYYPIQPLVMYIDPEETKTIEVRLAADNMAETLGKLSAAWKAVVPAYPWQYSFLDEDIKSQYRTDQHLSDVLGAFSVVSLAIAALGLLGLAAHEAEQRLKELGVRKVLGASSRDILLLLVKGLLGKLALGGIMALAISYFLVQKWLESFTYRIDLSGAIFAEAFVATCLIASIPIALTALKAARVNPVRFLRED